MRRTTVILAAVLLVTALPAPATAQRRLTLSEAVALAERQNPQLRAARESVVSAEAGVLAATGRMLPNVSLSALWNFAERVQVIQNPFPIPGGPTEFEIDFTQDYQGQVNVAVPVWTWGATRAGLRDARAGVQDATTSLESQRSAVALQVTQAYYGVLLAREGVDVAGDALAQAQRQEAVAAERLAAGAASEFELLRARVQVANLRPAVAHAEAALRQASIGLNLLLGLPPDEVVEIAGELSYEPVDLDLDALRQEALTSRPEMRSARLARQRADLALTMARSLRLPTVAVSGTYAFRSDNATWSERFNDNYMANLVLSMPLFDGFNARSNVQRARAGGRQADILLEQTERAILAEVEQAYRDLHAAEQSYLAQVDNVAQAERALQIAQVSFENEIMTSVELMDSQLALTMARQNHSRSLYDYQVALARIRTAVGRPVVR